MTQTFWPQFDPIPGTHVKAKGENKFHDVVFWPPNAGCGMHVLISKWGRDDGNEEDDEKEGEEEKEEGEEEGMIASAFKYPERD